MGSAAELAKRIVRTALRAKPQDKLTFECRSNGARAGEVIGLLINGFVSERFGYRKTMIGALIAMTGFIFILFFAPNVQTLVIGEVFCGIPWGM